MTNPHEPGLSADDKRHFDEVAAQFDATWEPGDNGDPGRAIRKCLPAEAPLRTALRLELALIDLERSNARVEPYLRAFPEFRADRQAVRALIATEYQTRRHTEPQLLLADVVQRFPDYTLAEFAGDESVAQLTNTGFDPAEESTAARAAPSTSPPATWAADRESVSRFVIRREHAKGGLGQVSLADDSVLGREVALKEIRTECDDPGRRRRFVEEAAITARLEHPGVIPIYAQGSGPDGRPWYAMKFVRGQTLTDAIKDHHTAAAPQPWNKLLRRFVDVCQTIAYAHSRNVIHRDVKPPNIMLGAYGETLLVDWGLAKRLGDADAAAGAASGPPTSATSDDGQTQPGDVLGTPAYMAPEQIDDTIAPVGIAADVYALGAVLYHLLTGSAPYRGKSVPELQTLKIQGTPPEKPSTINPSVPRALEAVCRKAMASRPTERYASAADLARDIEHWLADESVHCYPDPLYQRSIRWARHHPGKTTALVTGLPLLLALVVGTVLWRQQLWNSVEELLQRGDDLIAASKFQDAIAPVSQAQTALGNPVAAGMDGLRQRVARTLGRAQAQVNRVDFLRDADDAEYHILGSYWTALPHETHVRRIERVSERASDLATGLARAERALARYGLPVAVASVEALRATGLSDVEAATVLSRAGELLVLLALGSERASQGGADAEKPAALRRSLRLLEAAETLGNRSPASVRFRAEFHKKLGESPDAATASSAGREATWTFLDFHLKGAEMSFARRWPEAASAFESALALRRNDYWALFRLSRALQQSNQLPQAEALFRSCIALRPTDPTPRNNRCEVLRLQQRYDEAAAETEALLRDHPHYMMGYVNLILIHAERKQTDQAVAVLQRYLERKPNQPASEAAAQMNVGLAYERVGNFPKALDYYEAAARLHTADALIHRNRAIVLAKMDRNSEADQAILQAIERDPKNGELHLTRGTLLAERQSWEPALASLTEAIQLDSRLVTAWYNRSYVLRKMGRRADGLSDLNQALTLKPDHSPYLHDRAQVYASLKNFEAALDDLNRIRLPRQKTEPDARGAPPQPNPLEAEILRTRGKVLGDMGQFKVSEDELTRAIALAADVPEGYRDRAVTRLKAENWRGAIDDFRTYLNRHPSTADAAGIHNDISTAYLALGQYQEALEALNKAVSLEATSDALTNRGYFHLRRGDIARAVSDFDTALQADAKHARAQALRGQARLRLGDYANAATDLTRVLDDNSYDDRFETLVLRALANRGRDNDREVRADLDAVARDAPATSVPGSLARGMLHVAGERLAEAIVELSRALDDPTLRTSALALRARAWAAIGGRGLLAATADANALAAAAPKEGPAQLEAACIFAAVAERGESKDAAEARGRAFELLRRALELQPDLRGQLPSKRDFKALAADARFRDLISSP